MAAPVLTVTVIRRGVMGDHRYVDATLNYDTGNYVTGGAPITPANFGMVRLDGIDVLGSSIHGAEWDQVAGTMLLRVKATGAEVGSGVALTASSAIKVRAVGI